MKFDSKQLDLAEADDYGVASMQPRLLLIELGGDRHWVVRLSGKRPPKLALVLRHPCIQKVDADKFTQAVLAFKQAELQRRYPLSDRLTGPLPLSEPAKRVLGRVLVPFPEPKGTTLRGCFCSELVARFYERIGLQLFDAPVVAEQTSPNHLGQSRLRIVANAVFTPADIPDDAYCDVHPLFLKDLRSDEIDPEAPRRRSKLGRKEPPRTYLTSSIKLRELMELEMPRWFKISRPPPRRMKRRRWPFASST